MKTIILKSNSDECIDFLKRVLTSVEPSDEIVKEWDALAKSLNVYDNSDIEEELIQAKVTISGNTVKLGTLKELKAKFNEFTAGHSAPVALKAKKNDIWVTVRSRNTMTAPPG